MAESLVPGEIPPSDIISIYVASAEVKDKLQQQLSDCEPIIAQPDMFFLSALRNSIPSNISIFEGDMFFSNMQTLTISVNCVGIMGKGLASRAKYQFPDVYVYYQDLCRSRRLKLGLPCLYKREESLEYTLAYDARTLKNGDQQKWFLLFPTKGHWKLKSDIEGIKQGLKWLQDNYEREGIKSLAIPALGCGLGKLDWKDVGPLMVKHLIGLDIPVEIYLPAEKRISDEFLKKEFLLKDYQKANLF